MKYQTVIPVGALLEFGAHFEHRNLREHCLSESSEDPELYPMNMHYNTELVQRECKI